MTRNAHYIVKIHLESRGNVLCSLTGIQANAEWFDKRWITITRGMVTDYAIIAMTEGLARKKGWMTHDRPPSEDQNPS